MGIKADLISCMQEFIKAHDGLEPKKIHLTKADERALASMTRDEAGGSVSGNVREDWKTISGVEVVWDSDMRRCE